MGFDYKKGEFTPTNHELLPAQVVPMIFELQPGDVRYIEADEVYTDRTPERKVWINGYARAFNDEEILELGDDDPENFARIFCVNQGIVVDFSHLEIYSWDSLYTKLHRQAWPNDEIADQINLPLPVIGTVFNSSELEVITPALTMNNIAIEKTELLPLLAAITDAIELDEDELELDEPEDYE